MGNRGTRESGHPHFLLHWAKTAFHLVMPEDEIARPRPHPNKGDAPSSLATPIIASLAPTKIPSCLLDDHSDWHRIQSDQCVHWALAAIAVGQPWLGPKRLTQPNIFFNSDKLRVAPPGSLELPAFKQKALQATRWGCMILPSESLRDFDGVASAD